MHSLLLLLLTRRIQRMARRYVPRLDHVVENVEITGTGQ